MSVQLRERDPEYYKDEGDLVVAVEDRLFRVYISAHDMVAYP